LHNIEEAVGKAIFFSLEKYDMVTKSLLFHVLWFFSLDRSHWNDGKIAP